MINQDITIASTLKGEFYSCKNTFSINIEKIFANSWQLITDYENINNNKDAFPFFLLEDTISEPLVLINNDGNIHCYSSVCTHRGNILIHNKCNVKKNIMCCYHGKQFDSYGKFKFMPKTKGMKNFPSKRDDLYELTVKRWKQFIFTSITPTISFEDLFVDVENRVGWMPIETFKYNKELSKEYIVNANWALYCDNYLEGFHIPFIHNDLNNVLSFENYQTEIFKYSNLQVGIADSNEICFDLPKKSQDYGKKIAAYYFWLFPNLMLNFYPWGLSINIVTPISTKKTKVEFKSYVWDESKLNNGAGADLDKVEKEDEEVVENVQKGVSSRFYKCGRFSPSMEKGVHHFHTLISEFINKKA
ncbi:MAG: choline monooxygenase [Flavobacteriales bacterium]|nr:choline monooxygenase [Flavobacteriales bacterium]